MTEVIDDGELPLAAEFPPATRQQWQRLVARIIGRGGDPGDAPERELATVTADGIEIAPLYVAADGRPDPGYPGQAPFVRGRTAAGHRAGWDVRQRHEHPDPAVAREQVMEDLEGAAVLAARRRPAPDRLPAGGQGAARRGQRGRLRRRRRPVEHHVSAG
jgi:methylmalonyl-CoA mutase